MYGKDFLKRENMLSVESDFFGNFFFFTGDSHKYGSTNVELIQGVVPAMILHNNS